MDPFEQLQEEIEAYLDTSQVQQVRLAFRIADKAHHGQKRRTGEPYITHPVSVALILAGMRMDHESVMAALLHDVLEDTEVTKLDLVNQFGENVAELVDGVSKLTQIKFENIAEQQAENFRKMLLAMVRDIRVILVKLADRLHNMRTLNALPIPKRRRIARETLEIYAPIANRLGMNNFRVEFEELGFAAQYPLRAKVLTESVKKARGNRKEIMAMITSALRKGLQEKGLSADALEGREKHLYSIYKKMRKKNVSFSQIMDFFAFRIVLDNNDDCYSVLGLVHGLYKPVPGRFKDYIAIPKANGYQSLHTTLFGPYGVPIEMQIRTQDMHKMAEQGIAAHWLYKTPETSVNEAQASTREWLSSLLEMQNNAGTPAEFMQNVKIDLFPDEVYVFTPKGDIMELPSGATAVDFAYAVHTDVGNACVAVRIDRQLAPLSTSLFNGQTIEVITAPGARPNPAWLNFVVTGKAKSNIRHFLKSQKRAEAIELGKRLLETALANQRLSWNKFSQATIDFVLNECNLSDLSGLYVELGIGNRTAILVARRLIEIEGDIVTREANHSESLAIKGTEGMIVHFAKCCWPIPGDPILGYLNYGEGLTVHTDFCRNMSAYRENPEKCVPLHWCDTVEGEYQVELKIEVMNLRGILATLASVISEANANIDMIKSEDKDGRYAIVTLILAIKNRDHLAKIMRRIRTLKTVTRIQRSKT